MRIHTDVIIYTKGIEAMVTAEGTVTHGGSDSYGSDEPSWVDVDDIQLYRPNGGKLSPALSRRIMKDNKSEISEALCLGYACQ